MRGNNLFHIGTRSGKKLRIAVGGGALFAAMLLAPGSARAACGGVSADVLDGKFSEAASLCTSDSRLAPPALPRPATASYLPPIVDTPQTAEIRMAGARRAYAAQRRVKGGAKAGRVRSPVLQGMIHHVARQYRIDPRLLASIVRTESAGRSDAVSHKGALGLMQVMPGTARQMGVANPSRLLVDDRLSLETGARYLKHLQSKFGNNVPIVVAAYNAGPGAIQKYRGRIPPYRETQGYVGKVMSGYQRNIR